MHFFLNNLKVFLRKNKYFSKFYYIAVLLKKKITSYIDNFRFRNFIDVYKDKRLIFKILDMGEITRMRADLFESKEPETLNWIDGFEPNDNFLDIGANVGVYSIYAALNKINVISVEPDSLNYALLNINIRENGLNNFIIPYSVALNDIEKFSFFNVSSIEWGGALNSFDNTLDFKGNKFAPIHKQGVYGLPLDSFLKLIKTFPSHIKIDVDGNEYLILKGAINTLKSKKLKSLLVELDESRKDYKDSLEIIESSGLVLTEKTHAEMFNIPPFNSTFNHLFKRKKSL